MTRKRFSMLLLTLVTLCFVGVELAGDVTAQPPRRPGGRPPGKPRRDEVVGAIWYFVANNGPSVDGTSETPRKIDFRYRAVDFALHDMRKNDVIGKTEPLGPGKSRVTFHDNSRFPCSFEIEQIRKPPKPLWKGKAEFEGQTWAVTLEGVRN